MATRHFILTNDGRIEEFSEDQASRVANGTEALTEFADTRLRYVQVAFDEQADHNGEYRVRTLGAIVSFDANGRVDSAATPDGESESLSQFEHDACVQFALRETLPGQYALN